MPILSLITGFFSGTNLKLMLGVAALIGAWWLYHHVIEIGEDKARAAQTAANLKEAQHVQQVEANASNTISDLQSRLAAALIEPVQPAVTVRMCVNPSRNESANSNQGAGVPSNAAGGPGGRVGEDDLSLDIAPPTEAILKRDKAVIDYLQGYIRACQTAGACGR
jgi:hypothetical protein